MILRTKGLSLTQMAATLEDVVVLNILWYRLGLLQSTISQFSLMSMSFNVRKKFAYRLVDSMFNNACMTSRRNLGKHLLQ